MRYYPNRFNFLSNNFFDDFFTPSTSKMMACDIKEDENNYQLLLEMPGFEKDDISLSLDHGYLSVEAKRENETKEENDKYLRQERYTGSYQRSFYVGDSLTEEDIQAKYDNGVLMIDVPKNVQREVPEKKYISIG